MSLADLRKYANAYDQFGDGCTIVPQSLLAKAADAIDGANMARTRLDDFADKANAGLVHHDAREWKRRIWAAFADFDAAR